MFPGGWGGKVSCFFSGVGGQSPLLFLGGWGAEPPGVGGAEPPAFSRGLGGGAPGGWGAEPPAEPPSFSFYTEVYNEYFGSPVRRFRYGH
jgi:hypothetical protein